MKYRLLAFIIIKVKQGENMPNIIKRFCNTFLVEGIFALVIGLLILLLPQISTLALSLMISVGLILTGIYKLISAIIRRDEIENSWLSSIIAFLIIGIGTYLTLRPLFSLAVLTIAVGIYFMLEGANSMIIAFQSKNIFKHWWVGILAGFAQFTLAFLIFFWFPQTALYTIGMLIGINLLLAGIALISVYTGASCKRMLEA